MATWAWFTSKCKWVNFVVEFNFLFLCRNIYETEYIAILLQSIKICLSEWKQSILTWLFPQARGLGGRKGGSIRQNGALAPNRVEPTKGQIGSRSTIQGPSKSYWLLAIAAFLWFDPMGFTRMKRLLLTNPLLNTGSGHTAADKKAEL